MILGVALAFCLQDPPYDPDPRHPWNELHRALFTWRPTEADQPEEIEQDPVCWPIPKKPWTPWSVSKNLSGAIDRFNEKQVQDPLQRAILQHDLWMFLDGLEGLPMSNTRSWELKDEALKTDLRRRLVPVLKQLALEPDAIRSLPDNYA